jgi:hypothetical protein
MRKYLIILILFVTPVYLIAQTGFTVEQVELHKLTNNWLVVNNPAGLAFVNFQQYGNTELAYGNEGGNLHRAQEGNKEFGLKFNSERYDKINKNWMSWGSFEFKMNTEENRKWSNVFNTYNSSPYLFGDSVAGRYDLQSFDLHAKICRNIQDQWSVGVGLDYFAGDMSRLSDPRTRTFVANYSITPAAVYRINNHNIVGLSSGFRFEKEKMPSVTTVQDDPEISYYFFLGNENANGIKDAYIGFDRQFINRAYFAEAQYNFLTKNLDWLSTIGVSSGKQEVLGSEREGPGEFLTTKIHLNSKANISIYNKLLVFDLKSSYQNGLANEFLQELVTTRDTVTHDVSKNWITLYVYNNRYSTTSFNTSFNISLRNLLNNGTDYSWSAGVDGQFYGFSNIYQLPYSAFENQRARFGVNGSMRVFNKNQHRVKLQVAVGYAFSVSDNLELNSIATTVPDIGSTTFEKATYKIANQILQPDMNFYKQNSIDFRADARYSFPLKVKKSVLTGQVKAYFGVQRSENLGSWTSAGVSVGIITL